MSELANHADIHFGETPSFLQRGGDLGRLIAAHDWKASGLGPLSGWPPSLRTTVGFMLSSNVPLVLLWGRDGIMIYNEGYATIAGRRHPSCLGSRVLESWPEVASFNANVLDVGFSGRSLSYTDTHLVLFRAGSAEDVWLDLNYSPIFEDDGEPAGVLAIVVETTRRHLAEEEFRSSQERLSHALNAAGVIGIWDWHVGQGRIYADERLACVFGLDSERVAQGVSREEFLAPVHPDDREFVGEAYDRAIETGSELNLEYRLIAKDGGLRWLSARGTCFRDGSGETVRLSGAVVDITSQKASEENRRLLVRELHHRVKNTFAVIGGMVTMTARTATSVQDMANVLRGRLVALAGAHDLFRPAITAEIDHTEQTTLAELFSAILLPHLHHADQFILEAPPVEVGVTAATSLALVLHELTTNSVKFGSLSTPKGRLRVLGRLTEDDLILDWIEEGGPELMGPPLHHGFGSRLASMSISGQLAGSIEFHWKGTGLEAVLRMSRDRLTR